VAVTLSKEVGKVGIIKFNRPPANSYDHDFMRELDQAIYEARFDRDVKVIVLTSELPGFFCAGADVKALAEGDDHYRSMFDLHAHETLAKLERTPKLVIAAIGGHCLGGGLEIALACDMRFMGRGGERPATIGLPEVKLGVIPGTGGTQRLPRLIGLSKAMDLMVTGDSVQADRALELGIVDKVLDLDALLPETMKYAEKLASGPSLAVGAIKLAAQQGVAVPLEYGNLIEREILRRIFETQDAAEGMTAFAERRKEPVQWQGK
jgi:enoyl-CoA hydratase/carnithine racemase